MTTQIDPSAYQYIPGESHVVDMDLDSVGLHDLNGTPITEDTMLQASLDVEAHHSGVE